jgi:excisionase family DNA binding protein
MKSTSSLTFLTVSEAATALRCSSKTVRKMIRSGEIAGQKLARRWVIPAVELRRIERQAMAGIWAAEVASSS